MKKTLKTDNKNKEKNWQIEIDKKSLNSIGTEKKTQSTG